MNVQVRKSVIKRLDEVSVSRICVNQVIADLTSCVKELVENSLDAGATRIEITLKEQGKDGIDVIDNGSGITKENLNKIAEKGATSKLRDFNDITSLRTFGFRGEALNALSVLCTLSITTRVESEEVGVKYTFGSDKGSATSVPIHREKGTTVSLRNIFARIPVRKQEFEKNISSQYTKMLSIMREYMLIAKHCSIFVVNDQSKKGGRQVVLNSGQPAQTMKSKIAAVFGHSLSESLSEFSFDFGSLPSASSCHAEGYVLNKHISGSTHALSSKTSILKNKGLLWVNNRPTSALQKTNSIFAEIYKKYNEAAEFVYFLHLHVAPDDVDFNLSPDKRDIILKPEKEFYSALHSNLAAFFERIGAVSRVLMPAPSNKRSDILSVETNDQTYIAKKPSLNPNSSHSSMIAEEENSFDQNRNSIKSKSQEKQTISSASLNHRSSISSQQSTINYESSQNQQLFPGNNNYIISQRTRIFKEDQLSLAAQRKLAMERLLGTVNDSFADAKFSRDDTNHSALFEQSSKQVYSTLLESKEQEFESKQEDARRSKGDEDHFEDRKSPEESKHYSSEEPEEDNKLSMTRYTDSPPQITHLSRTQFAQLSDNPNLFFEEQSNIISNSNNNDIQSDLISKSDDQNERIQNNHHPHEEININHKEIEQESIVDDCCHHHHHSSKPDSSPHLHNDTISISIEQANESKEEQQHEQNQKNQDSISDFQNKYHQTRSKKLNGSRQFDIQHQEYILPPPPIRNESKTYLKELADDYNSYESNGGKDDMFTKEGFASLHVIGQFNKAFIIAYSAERNEIFLIDQHASDEKTNFEKLMIENVFSCQKLLQPIVLDVTSSEVDILENNRDIFTRNGFSFSIVDAFNDPINSHNGDDSKLHNPPEDSQVNSDNNETFDEQQQESRKKKLRIEQLPASKYIQFDISDFDELFSKLNCETFDAQHYRPKKIQRILASKACRKSIMVGEALNEAQMKQILVNLSELQSPWNCPHGRPTMVKTPPFQSLYAQIQVKNRFQL